MRVSTLKTRRLRRRALKAYFATFLGTFWRLARRNLVRLQSEPLQMRRYANESDGRHVTCWEFCAPCISHSISYQPTFSACRHSLEWSSDDFHQSSLRRRDPAAKPGPDHAERLDHPNEFRRLIQHQN